MRWGCRASENVSSCRLEGEEASVLQFSSPCSRRLDKLRDMQKLKLLPLLEYADFLQRDRLLL